MNKKKFLVLTARVSVFSQLHPRSKSQSGRWLKNESGVPCTKSLSTPRSRLVGVGGGAEETFTAFVLYFYSTQTTFGWWVVTHAHTPRGGGFALRSRKHITSPLPPNPLPPSPRSGPDASRPNGSRDSHHRPLSRANVVNAERSLRTAGTRCASATPKRQVHGSERLHPPTTHAPPPAAATRLAIHRVRRSHCSVARSRHAHHGRSTEAGGRNGKGTHHSKQTPHGRPARRPSAALTLLK